MKKNFKIVPFVCWMLILVVTATIYALLVDGIFSSAVKAMSVIFVLLAEVILCVKFLSKNQSIIMNSQIAFGGIYLVCVLLLSVIYVNIASPNLKWFIAIHLVLLVLLSVADLTVLNIHNRTANSDAELARNQRIIVALYALMNEIVAENTNSKFLKELNDISETLKYCDNSLLAGNENALSDKLEELKEILRADTDGEVVKKQVQDIKALLKNREIYMKQKQRGKF